MQDGVKIYHVAASQQADLVHALPRSMQGAIIRSGYAASFTETCIWQGVVVARTTCRRTCGCFAKFLVLTALLRAEPAGGRAGARARGTGAGRQDERGRDRAPALHRHLRRHHIRAGRHAGRVRARRGRRDQPAGGCRAGGGQPLQRGGAPGLVLGFRVQGLLVSSGGAGGVNPLVAAAQAVANRSSMAMLWWLWSAQRVCSASFDRHEQSTLCMMLARHGMLGMCSKTKKMSF